MATQRESPEYRAVRKHYRELTEAVTRGAVPDALFENEVITEDSLSECTLPAKIDREKGKVIMKDVLQAIRLDPEVMFQNFCDSLGEEGALQCVVKKVKATLEKLKEEHDQQGSEEYHILKEELDVLCSTLKSASDQTVEMASVKCIKDKIRQYIEKSLKSSSDTSQIEADMESLRTQLVIPTMLWQWTSEELAEAKERLTKDMSTAVSLPAAPVKPATPETSLFSKDTLYHASLCCGAVNLPNLVNIHTYFENKNPHHSFSEVSISQNRDTITPYLIAKQEDVLYVAFQSTPLLSEWMDATSFDEGLRKQSIQIPLRFFIEQLNQNRKIVLTGFSFGGMLACCVNARLWHSTTAKEILLQRVICITFGQPFLQIRMVTEEIEICPDFEKTIHSVFIKDDQVPLMFGCLNLPNLSSLAAPQLKALAGPSDDEFAARFSEQCHTQQGDLFSEPFVKAFLHNLHILQQYSLEQSKPHSASPMAHKKREYAVEKLTNALQSIAVYEDQIPIVLYGNCYVIYKDIEGTIWKQQPKHFATIELGQRTKLVVLDDRLFQLHTMDTYMHRIFRSHLEKHPEKYIKPNPVKQVAEIGVLKPKITGMEVHEYPNEHVIVLQGENLWFSYKICIDEKGDNQRDVCTPADSTTRFEIEFHVTDTVDVCSTLCSGKQVKIALFTHFAKPIRQSMDTKREPHVFSLKQIQLAKHIPTDVIRLAYLCALLEQRGQPSESKRFKAVGHFLEQVVKIVPLESVFVAIAYEKHDIALECAEALKKRNPQLQPSQQMIIGARKAVARACTGYDGATIDQDILMFTQILGEWILGGAMQQFVSTRPQQQVQLSSEASVVQQGTQQQSQPGSKPRRKKKARSKSHTKALSLTPQSSKKQGSKPMHLAGISDQVSPTERFSPSALQPPCILPLPFPIMCGPPPRPFPPYMVKYLESCVKNLEKQLLSGKVLNAVSNANIDNVYSVSDRRAVYFKSPLQVLREAMDKIAIYTEDESWDQMLPADTMHSEQMLKLVDKIFKRDVTVCASLLGAFMEQQIRIPLLNTAKATAETLSSKAAPVAVGVWALFSQNLGGLQAMLEENKHNKLIVEIKEYIKGISEQLPENEDRMYAGKLQFLLQGLNPIVTASNQYISYSLEHQLCSNLQFDKNISLKKLILQWDTIFKNDALSLIAMSHRPLVARWLKWTILIHDLREALAQYTCIGVTGLINSGKSLLVQKLFGIEKVKVGTRAAKRTTVPLLYNLEDSVDGLDVIDFPGVDDSDHTVPELVDLLLSLAQIIVFVVDYRKATSDPVKRRLQVLSKNGVSVLICLTHADVLYLECAKDNRREDIGKELHAIRKNLQLDAHHSPEVSFYSFEQIPEAQTSTEDLKKFGIKSPADVGDWLVQVLRTRFKQEELADKLEGFIQTD